MKVSFDFDEVLDNEVVQKYAKYLINKNEVEVYIVTSRYPCGKHPDFPAWNNNDLFEVADEIGIKRENIVFTEWADKWTYFYDKQKEFIWHLDDYYVEINGLLAKTKVPPIRFPTGGWKEKCERLINKKRKINP